MVNRTMWCALPMLLAAQAAGQPVLYGVQGNGDLVRIDPATGAATFVGSSGFACRAAAAIYYDGLQPGPVYNYVLTGGGAQADEIIALNPWTGTASVFRTTTGRPTDYEIHGLAISTGPFTLYAILSTNDPTTGDLLASINWYSGAYTIIGPTGRTDLEALTASPGGVLYALGTNNGGTLVTLDTSTGAAATIGSGGFGADNQALAYLRDGRLLACRANLLSVNPSTGQTSLIGATGFSDIRALAALNGCYPNCAMGSFPPTLNVVDFNCFLSMFAAGAPYANCDMSTTPPVLNVLDFICFLNRFAAGCP